MSAVFDKATQIPQVLAILLQNLPEITTKFPDTFVKNHILPMMVRAFDSEYHEIQAQIQPPGPLVPNRRVSQPCIGYI